MPIGWILGAYRFLEWFFKEGEDVLEIRAAMRRLGWTLMTKSKSGSISRSTRMTDM